MIFEETIDGYLFSSDKGTWQFDVIHNDMANDSYWSKGSFLET